MIQNYKNHYFIIFCKNCSNNYFLVLNAAETFETDEMLHYEPQIIADPIEVSSPIDGLYTTKDNNNKKVNTLSNIDYDSYNVDLTNSKNPDYTFKRETGAQSNFDSNSSKKVNILSNIDFNNFDAQFTDDFNKSPQNSLKHTTVPSRTVDSNHNNRENSYSNIDYDSFKVDLPNSYRKSSDSSFNHDTGVNPNFDSNNNNNNKFNTLSNIDYNSFNVDLTNSYSKSSDNNFKRETGLNPSIDSYNNNNNPTSLSRIETSTFKNVPNYNDFEIVKDVEPTNTFNRDEISNESGEKTDAGFNNAPGPPYFIDPPENAIFALPPAESGTGQLSRAEALDRKEFSSAPEATPTPPIPSVSPIPDHFGPSFDLYSRDVYSQQNFAQLEPFFHGSETGSEPSRVFKIVDAPTFPGIIRHISTYSRSLDLNTKPRDDLVM